jgi:hypothetical protein
VDDLRGLKENVLLGHLIPAGTGFDSYSKMKVQKLVEPPSPEEDGEAMLAEAAEAAEALGAESPPAVLEVLTPGEKQPERDGEPSSEAESETEKETSYSDV